MNCFDLIANDLLRYFINRILNRHDSAIFRCVCRRFKLLYDVKRLSRTGSLILYASHFNYKSLTNWLIDCTDPHIYDTQLSANPVTRNIKIEIMKKTVQNQDMNTLKKLVKNGYPLNQRLIVDAVIKNNMTLVKYLEKQIPNSTVQKSCLYIAAKYCDLDMLLHFNPFEVKSVQKPKDDAKKAIGLTSYAAKGGNLNMLKWLIENNFPRSIAEFNSAALFANKIHFDSMELTVNHCIKVMEFLLNDRKTNMCLAYPGVLNIEILEWLDKAGFTHYNDNNACRLAAMKLKIDTLVWLLDHGFELSGEIYTSVLRRNLRKIIHSRKKEIELYAMLEYLKQKQCPWDEDSLYTSILFCDKRSLKWLIDNGCPWNKSILLKAAKNSGQEKRDNEKNLAKKPKVRVAHRFYKWLKYDSGYFDYKRQEKLNKK